MWFKLPADRAAWEGRLVYVTKRLRLQKFQRLAPYYVCIGATSLAGYNTPFGAILTCSLEYNHIIIQSSIEILESAAASPRVSNRSSSTDTINPLAFSDRAEIVVWNGFGWLLDKMLRLASQRAKHSHRAPT